MASGALPPAFPAVRIDGDLYWDGGILSNTPVEAIFDDNPRRNSLIFAVHIWNSGRRRAGEHLAGDASAEGNPVFEPRDHAHRAPAADSSPAPHHRGTRETHSRVGAPERRSCAKWRPTAASRACMSCASWRRGSTARTTPRTSTSAAPGIRKRWEAGLADARRALEAAPWEADVDPIEGFYLHELKRRDDGRAGKARAHAAAEDGCRVRSFEVNRTSKERSHENNIRRDRSLLCRLGRRQPRRPTRPARCAPSTISSQRRRTRAISPRSRRSSSTRRKFLWVSDGMSFWGPDALVKRMAEFQLAEVWRVDPDLAKAAIVEVDDGAAYIHMPLALTIGLKAKPDVIRFLVSILCVKKAEGWRIAALFTTTEKTN